MSSPKSPTDYNLPDRETLSSADVGSLGLALLTLTQEVWVLTDRLNVMEAVLAKHGMDISEEIQNFQPNEVMQDRLRQEGAALSQRILTALAKS